MRLTRYPRLPLVIVLAALVVPALAPAPAAAQTTGEAVVRFVPFEPFDDALFTNVDGSSAATQDPDTGDLWYTTSGGLVHVNANRSARRVLTVDAGMPTPLLHDLSLGTGTDLWVGSDAGLVRVDRATEAVKFWNPGNDPTAPAYITTLAYADPFDPAHVWVGTRDHGVARFAVADETWVGRWNTTVERNHPVRGVSATADAVYFAARDSGFLRYDRATGLVAPVLEPERNAFRGASAVHVRADGERWFGTDSGVWRHVPGEGGGEWTRYNGTVMSDVRVQDITERRDAVWVATRTGVSIYNRTTDAWSIIGVGAGLLHNNVRGLAFSAQDVALFSTLVGLTTIDMQSGERRNFVTGVTNGPNSNSMLGGTAYAGRVWFGSTHGVSAFDPATQEWLSLGIVDGLDPKAPPVYEVEASGDRLWLATRQYVWSYNLTSNEWLSIRDDQGSNQYLHLEVDGDVLWLPEWNTGLIEYNWRENTTRRYTYLNSALFDWLVTDAHATPSDVWVATWSGLYRLDKLTRTFTHQFSDVDGFPASELQELFPDGRDLFVAVRENGLARFDTDARRVTAVWNASNGKLPGNEVRAVQRDGSALWLAMGPEGLVRFEPGTGRYRQWGIADGMPEAHANGLALKDGILYVSTHGGLGRFDTKTESFLPMFIGDPNAWLAANPPPPGSEVASGAFPPSVRVTDPVSGSAVTGLVTVFGDAARPGGSIERVEVAIDDGPFTAATGTTRWSFDWDARTVAPGEHVVRARAVSGNATSTVATVTVDVVPPPTVPLTVTHTPPVGNAFAGAPFRLSADVTGDDPLSLVAFYQSAGAAAFKRLAFVKEGATWLATVPAEAATPGEFRYFLEASSGRLKATTPEDRTEPFVLDLAPPPPSAVTVSGPPRLTVTAGTSVDFTLNVRNAGTAPDNYEVQATGLRATWVSFDPTPFRLSPGEATDIALTVQAPAKAFAANTTLTFLVKPLASSVQPARGEVALTVVAATESVPATPTAPREKGGLFGIPAPGALVALASVAVAVSLLRPRRGGDDA